MRRLAALLALAVACGGNVRAGLVSDGRQESNQMQDGCDRERPNTTCSGYGYDDVAIAVAIVAVGATLLIHKLRDR